ncbi:hypothetical protein PMAYCL1PPCAC_18871, partial [Pristionchus mayeri]
ICSSVISTLLTMETRVPSAFSSEASDYFLPPSHKVIVLMDHGPRMAIDANCPVNILAKNAPIETRKCMSRNLWTMAIEATLEAHRVVSDLFPDGSRLMRFVLADAVSRKLNSDWGKTLLRQPELLTQLGSTGAPTTAAGAAGDADATFLPLGVQLAVETLSETTDRYRKMKNMDPKEQVPLIKYLSHSFAWKIHPTKTTQERIFQEQGLKLGKTAVTKTIVSPNGEEEEDTKKVQRPCYIMNKGSILVLTRMKSDAEVAALEKEVTEAIETRNAQIAKTKDRKFTAKVDHVSLFILNLLPVGEKATVTGKPLTKMNETLSCGVRSCCVKGNQLITGVHGMLMPLYDLASTTVTGIPMKEESNASHSVNYDVELLHQRIAHSELARNGLLMENMPKAATYPVVMGTNEGGDTKKEQEDEIQVIEAKTPGLIAVLHDGAYSTVRLTWATPSPKTAWNMFPRSGSSYPVTPSYLNARPSICLTSFLGQGKSVMLEVKNPPLAPLLTVEEQNAAIAERRERKKRTLAAMPADRRKTAENIVNRRLAERRKMRRATKNKAGDDAKMPTAKAPRKDKKLPTKRRGTGLQPNLHGTRLISHTLIAHSGRIYIHEIILDGGTTKCEMTRQAAGFKPVPDLRIPDFRGLIREMMITLPPKLKLIEYADKKAKGLLPKGEPPNKEARERALRLTRYWPLKTSHSFIYNVKQKLDPLFSLMRKAELSTADVDKCKQTIRKILEARDSPDLFTYTKFACDVMSDQQNREEQLSTLLREITAHLTNYAAHSERHTEVFTHWAQASGEDNANSLDPTQLLDVHVPTRFSQLFVQEVAEDDVWRVRRMGRAGRGGGGAADLVAAAAACSRHAKGEGRGDAPLAEDEDCARIRAPQRALAVAMAVLQGNYREGGEPLTKKAKVLPKHQWTNGEQHEILHLLQIKQDPTIMKPRRDFVGREQANGNKAKLYPQMGEEAERKPKPIVG